MIRVSGQTNGSYDSKLKAPVVGSQGASAAADRTVSTGEIAALRKEIVALGSRMVVLDARDIEWGAKIAALVASLTKVNLERETKPRRETRAKSQSQSQSHGESQSHKTQSHDDEPWKAAGVSRSTWFRQQKAKAKSL